MDSVIRTTTDMDNILTVWMDLPGKSVNTCSPQFFADLARTLDEIERDRPAGVIFTSPKPRSFNAGADLFEVRKMTSEQISEFVALGQSLFDRIAHLPMPAVAAINGNCMGGGFELALGCRYRVAVDDGSISIGLPEIKLGLIPAWGGATRLPRTIGLRRALPILLAGKTLPPKKAQRAGLVDEVVRPEALQAAAKRIVLSRSPAHRPTRLDRALEALPPIRTRVVSIAQRQTSEKTYGNYPAPMKLIEVVRTGYDGGFVAGLQAERSAIVELSETEAGRNLLRLFFLKQGAAKAAFTRVGGAKPSDVNYAAVIGGGTMGAGIVHALVRAGIPVRLVEVDPPAVSAALNRIKRMLDDDVSTGRIDRLAARHALNRVSPTIDWMGLELADFVVEAVVETIDAKRDVFSRLDRLTRPGAVLASNTSSLRISEIAQATLHPERVVGMHFFNPVHKMPLIEVVRGLLSDDVALATALALAGRIGKTPVLVNDAPGFLVNRILVPYLSEALALAAEGVPVDRIDEAAKRWGMPMGPFELLDEIGLDIAAHVLKSLAGTTSPPHNVISAFDAALDRKWLGKKSGKGFYVHGKQRRVNEELARSLCAGIEASPLDEEAIQWRLVLPMANEAARVLEEGVTDLTDSIDLCTVLGTGLAPFRGGIVQFVSTVGTDEIVRRLDELTAKHGPRFGPPTLLREAARTHQPLTPRAQAPSSATPREHAIHR